MGLCPECHTLACSSETVNTALRIAANVGAMKKARPATAFGKRFAANLKTEREKRGLSQEDLAQLARLRRCRIDTAERSERNISIMNMARLADALGIELRDLLVNGPPD